MPPAKLTIDALSVRYAARGHSLQALEGVSFEVPEGQFAAIVGPSGGGKSTLLRVLAGLERPTSGSVRIAVHDAARPPTSLVFQQASSFPWLSVAENIAYGLRMRHLPREQIRRQVDYSLALVGLEKFAASYPHQLSGGMNQRVALARALANDPEILLMDEPFAALDEQTKFLLHEELLRIWEESHKTVVFVTHSIDEALVLADRVIVLTARPGRIKADILVPFGRPRTPDQLRATPEFAALLGQIWQVLKGEVRLMEAVTARRG